MTKTKFSYEYELGKIASIILIIFSFLFLLISIYEHNILAGVGFFLSLIGWLNYGVKNVKNI